MKIVLSLYLLAYFILVISGQRRTTPLFGRAWGAEFCDREPTKSNILPNWPSGTRITIECPEGYALVADSGNESETTCRADGSWNNRLASCRRVGNLCRKPSTPDHTSIDQMSPAIDEDPNLFTVGSIIRFYIYSLFSNLFINTH